MLIVATAILVTIVPVLRRSSQGARHSEPRVSSGAVPRDTQQAPGAVAGRRGGTRVASFAPWARDRHDSQPRTGGRDRYDVQPRTDGRDRQLPLGQRAGEPYDEHEVEQMVREQLYGRRGRQR